MPKPLAGVQGSGMHTHISLFEGDVNAFHDPGDESHLSKVAKGFIAGLLTHAREITAVTNQWVNSYKRLVVGFEAPVYVAWARNNRSALVRVPGSKKGKESSTRIEFRSPDPACNPYLAFAVILAAGLKGIEEGYELPPELTANLYEMTAEERMAEGVEQLPGSLEEAIACMEHSELLPEALGEHVFEWFIRNKRAEWDALQDPGHAVRARPLPSHPLGGEPMEPLLVFPDPPPPGADERPRRRRVPVAAGDHGRRRGPPRAGGRLGGGGRSAPTTTPRAASPSAARCASATSRSSRCSSSWPPPSSTTWSCARTCSTTSACSRCRRARSRPACKHLFWRTGRGTRPELIEYGELVLNLETYQAAIAGRPLDLTYMEYELLKFLATHPGKVFTREMLLSRVWGYEYYGGARTVDVHIRRLRAKLTEEHAGLIQTVRSVGLPLRAVALGRLTLARLAAADAAVGWGLLHDDGSPDG